LSFTYRRATMPDGSASVPAVMSVFGFVMVTDLLRRDVPEVEMPVPANVWTF
jgi:hypothetical protein